MIEIRTRIKFCNRQFGVPLPHNGSLPIQTFFFCSPFAFLYFSYINVDLYTFHILMKIFTLLLSVCILSIILALICSTLQLTKLYINYSGQLIQGIEYFQGYVQPLAKYRH